MRPRSKSGSSSLLELVVIVAVALGLALAIQAWIVKPYRIPSGSMEPTLKVGQRVLVDRIGTHFGDPGIGDIIVFHPPKNYSAGCANPQQGQNADGIDSRQPCGEAQTQESSQNFIKRVVGLPGDSIAIRGGHVYRNNKREKDSYIRACTTGECDFPRAIVVPKGEYFMMGDNRGESDDSRFWGPIRKSWIIGEAFFTYWPPDRIGFL